MAQVSHSSVCQRHASQLAEDTAVLCAGHGQAKAGLETDLEPSCLATPQGKSPKGTSWTKTVPLWPDRTRRSPESGREAELARQSSPPSGRRHTGILPRWSRTGIFPY